MTVRRVGLWVAVVALLVAQTLGLAHRVVHPGGAVAGVEHTHAHTHGHEHESGHHPSLLAALFAGHDEAPDCRLYDQLSHADLLPALPVAVPALHPPALQLACHAAGFVARRSALFDARGPPPIR